MITNKSGVISRFWHYIRDSKYYNPEYDPIEDEDDSVDDYYSKALETIILNYANTKFAKELFIHLKLDATFKIQKDKFDPNIIDIIYKGEYLPFRVDLANHSPMGFSIGGGSSEMQLSLAILSTVISDSEALNYYEAFKPHVASVLSDKDKISTIEVLQWFLKEKRKRMENLVKYVCNELDITQKMLSEQIGVSEGTVNRWSAKPAEVPLQTKKTLQLLLENAQLKSNQEKLQKAISLIEEVKNTQNNSI